MFAIMRAKALSVPVARAPLGALLAACLVAAMPAQAGASPLLSGAALPLAAQMMASSHCGRLPPAIGLQANLAAESATSKASAILGGAPSALELMRMQQSAPGDNARMASTATPTAHRPLEPALGKPLGTAGCASFGGGNSTGFITAIDRKPSSPEDFLGSKRIGIGRTMFDNDWNRVRSGKVSRGQLARAVGTRRGSGLELIGQVNSWANHSIRYVEDRDLWGKADQWSTASTTLKLGKGDCEDIAIAKMQLLAAAGVQRKDMVLTIARDLVRNADHAVLIVRLEGRYLLLDNSTDQVLDASLSYDYRPVLSFSENRSWLHGY